MLPACTIFGQVNSESPFTGNSKETLNSSSPVEKAPLGFCRSSGYSYLS